MAQHDPDPAALPEAIPVLSYERQTDDGAMGWVVRFIGAWVICEGAAAASPQIVEVLRSGLLTIVVDMRYWQQLFLPASLICNLALIGFGVAIARQRRHAFYGGLTMTIVALMPELVVTFSTGGGRDALFSLLYTILPAAASFAVLLSVLRRADARSILHPIRVNRLDALEKGDSISFLISRLGWLYLAWGGRVVVSLAMLPLLIRAGRAKPEWSWQTGVSIALYLAVGACGLLLQQRKAWALRLLVWLLLIHLISQFVIQWSYAPARANLIPWLLYVYLSTVLETVASIVLLCLLAHKAARTGM